MTYKQRKLTKTINTLKEDLEKEKAKDKIDQVRIDSLIFAIELSYSNLKITNIQINNYPSKDVIKEDIANAKGKELKKLEYEPELTGFKFGWFSFYYKVENRSFKLFYPTQSFTQQIIDTSSVSHEIKIQYNKYYWTKDTYKTYFLSFGLSLSLTDNFNDLIKKEINEVKNYGPNPNDRTTTKKYNAYIGDYENGQKNVKLFGDYYRFLFSNNIAAIHLYPEFNFYSNSKPRYNLGFGLLLGLKDNKNEDKSLLNAEIFYNFLDISKNSNTDLKFLERNNIGLRFTFPINFITK